MKNGLRIGLALAGGALAALAWLLMRFDRSVTEWMYLRPLGVVDVARVCNYPGSWMVLIPLVGLSLAVFWRPGWVWKWRCVRMGMLAIAGADRRAA